MIKVGSSPKDVGDRKPLSNMFIHESKLCSEKQGRPRVRVRKGEVLPPQYYRKRMMFHRGLEVMAWGMISYLGDRILVRLDKTLNGPGYLRLLPKVSEMGRIPR